jgi:hypothetical protein
VLCFDGVMFDKANLVGLSTGHFDRAEIGKRKRLQPTREPVDLSEGECRAGDGAG